MELALPFSLEALCTYYLSEWQMFFKWWCLMCAELLPKPNRERLRDAIHHLMETSADSIPALGGFSSGKSNTEEEVVWVVCWGDCSNLLSNMLGPGPDGSKYTAQECRAESLIRVEFSECCEFVLVAATNIIYSKDMHIYIDRKTHLQVNLQPLSSTNWAKRKRSFSGVHF